MVTPPLQQGRNFCSEKSEAMLPLTYEEWSLALKDKEARVLFKLIVPKLVSGANMRVWVKRFEAMVAKGHLHQGRMENNQVGNKR